MTGLALLPVDPATTREVTASAGRGGVRRVARVTGMVLAGVVVVVALLLVIHPGTLSPTGPTESTDAILAGPSWAHWFGTDQLGRDLWARVVWGARPVLVASLLGVLAATLAGVTLGIVGGAAPRVLSAVVLRIVDVLLALPVLMIALMIIAIVGAGVWSIVIAVGIAFTPGYARVVATSVRRLRSAEYVEAAHMFGESGPRVAARHLLPNLATEIVVLITSGIGWAVLTSTTLSFLGLGVRLPAPDWGTDLSAGATYISTAWWLSTFPGAAITVTIIAANFLGDAIAEALDPRGDRQLRGALRDLGRLRPRRRPRTEQAQT